MTVIPRPDRPTRHLSLKLKGSARHQGLVRASDFVTFVSGVLTCLRRLERTRGGRDAIEYRISDLAVGSAIIEIEAESPSDLNELASVIVDEFIVGLEAARHGTLALRGYEPEVQQAFVGVLRPLGGEVEQITVRTESSEIEITQPQMPELLLKPQVESMAVGSLAGFIDAVNVHKTPIFYLYPTAGVTRVPCLFDRSLLLDDVRKAIKRYTTVYGVLEFYLGSAFPSRITVDRLEVSPPADELPTLRSLYGVAPNLTGGADSVSYVRRIRDAEN